MPTSKRGFASMSETRQRQIASRGGRAAHEKGTAHEFTPDEARQAGRKGGLAVSANHQHMSEIGRQGGKARSARIAGARQAADADVHARSDGRTPESHAAAEAKSRPEAFQAAISHAGAPETPSRSGNMAHLSGTEPSGSGNTGE